MRLAKEFAGKNAAKQQAKKDLLINQSKFFPGAHAKNEEWQKVAALKNKVQVSNVRGRAKGKVIGIWKPANKRVDGVEWVRSDFLRIISGVEDGTDPVFDKLNEMLSGLSSVEKEDQWEMLSASVEEIYEMFTQKWMYLTTKKNIKNNTAIRAQILIDSL